MTNVTYNTGVLSMQVMVPCVYDIQVRIEDLFSDPCDIGFDYPEDLPENKIDEYLNSFEIRTSDLVEYITDDPDTLFQLYIAGREPDDVYVDDIEITRVKVVHA